MRDDAIGLVGFPDTIWEPSTGFLPLIDAVREGDDVVLGLFHVAKPENCDVVETSSGYLTRITVKPRRPATNVTWGIAAARIAVLREIAGWDEPGAYFDWLASRTPPRCMRAFTARTRTPARMRRSLDFARTIRNMTWGDASEWSVLIRGQLRQLGDERVGLAP